MSCGNGAPTADAVVEQSLSLFNDRDKHLRLRVRSVRR